MQTLVILHEDRDTQPGRTIHPIIPLCISLWKITPPDRLKKFPEQLWELFTTQTFPSYITAPAAPVKNYSPNSPKQPAKRHNAWAACLLVACAVWEWDCYREDGYRRRRRTSCSTWQAAWRQCRTRRSRAGCRRRGQTTTSRHSDTRSAVTASHSTVKLWTSDRVG